jgi:predicted nucleotidyltransferase
MISFETSTEPDLMLLGVVLAELRVHAERCNADLLLIGAAARDILIRYVTGSAPQRATADIDIAVGVKSWDQVRELTQGLAATPGVPHKFTVHGAPVDIIPFGSVEDAHASSPGRTSTP